MFGSTDNGAAQAIKPFGQRVERGATNEMARPVPYHAGLTRVALTWISDHFADRIIPEASPSSGKGAAASGSKNVYSSILGLIGGGPFDCIFSIYANGELIWGSKEPYAIGSLYRSAASPDYVDITVPTHGTVRLYWGTETQLPDAYTFASSGNEHPAYRGFGYIVLKNWFCGLNQDSFQNIEVVMGRWPQPSWLAPVTDSSAAPMRIAGDCQPMAIVADWLQNPRQGLGLDIKYFLINRRAPVYRQIKYQFHYFQHLYDLQ